MHSKGIPLLINAINANVNPPEYAKSRVVVVEPMTGRAILKPDLINSLADNSGRRQWISSIDAVCRC